VFCAFGTGRVGSLHGLAAAFFVVGSPTPGAAVGYNDEVRAILSENCFYCHGPDGNKRKGDLRLDRREEAIAAGAIVPGDAAASTLIERLLSSDPDEVMPPPDSHRQVTPAQRDTLRRWIEEGAVYEEHWAFVAPQRPVPPANGETHPIDAFVVERLAAAGLTLADEAPRETLLRRLSLDLTGLPPTPDEIAAFLADAAPGAYERQVDRLLASPHYGERMALPWLDAARYADSNGFQQDGDTFQWVWRDWLVRQLNADKPFDRLSTEMLAGDLIPGAGPEEILGSAFNRNHILNGEGGAIAEEQRFNNLFDRVDTTATTWLGLTIACAQCHDHKYDPVTMRDYYALLDAFNRVPEAGRPAGGPSRFRLDETTIEVMQPGQAEVLAGLEERVRRAEADLAAAGPTGFEAWLARPVAEIGALPEGVPSPAPAGRPLTDGERAALRDHFTKQVWPGLAKDHPAGKELAAARAALDLWRRDELPKVMVMSDARPRETHVLDRGSYLSPLEKITFDTPAFLPPMPKDAPRNRLGLAQWLFMPEHPLTARVQVNRQWQLFFGHGIVRTSEDLGVQSERPTHRELLDWLAVEFRDSGFRLKPLQRLIVTSRTYRQSSLVTTQVFAADPENRLLSRAPRLRLPSPLLRDLALAASGLLVPTLGGAPVYPYQPENPWESLAITKERDFRYPVSTGDALYRRSLYTFWRRTIAPVNLFDTSARQACRVRTPVTSSPLHALTTLNDPTWVEAARVLAESAMIAAPDDAGRLNHAFLRVLGRPQRGREPALLARLLEGQRRVYAADPKAAEAMLGVGSRPRQGGLPVVEHAALTATCLAIFNLDAALTRE
jgi:mono/diheme cytochrome c family protein